MGRSKGNDGIGYMLRKVKSSGGLNGGWVPALGKMKKSSSSHDDLRLNGNVQVEDDVWGASESVLTPNMLPKLVPDECPPTTPRELLHSIRRKSTRQDSVNGRQTGVGNDVSTPRMLLAIQEAKEGESNASAVFEFDNTIGGAGRTRSSAHELTPRQLSDALTSAFSKDQISSDEDDDDFPVTFPGQQTNRSLRPLPKGLQAALMMSQPLSDHWSDKGEDWCSDVLTTQSEFDEDLVPIFGQRYGAGSHWDVLSESSGDGQFHRTMSSISEEAESEETLGQGPEEPTDEEQEEFRFPENRAVEFDQCGDMPSCMASWGLRDLSRWGEKTCTSQESGVLDGAKITTERTLFDLAVTERREDQDSKDVACVDCPEDLAYLEPVYDDGTVYSLETRGGVYYVQKLGSVENATENGGTPEGEQAEQCVYDTHCCSRDTTVGSRDGSRGSVEVENVGVYMRGDDRETAVVYQEYKEYEEEEEVEIMESAYLPVEGLDDVEGEYDDNVPDKERMWSDDDEEDDQDDDRQRGRNASSSNFDIGASSFFTTDQSVRPWGFGDDVNRDTSGCRDRSRASFDTADSSVIMSTALHFRMPTVSGADREKTHPSWVVDTAHTYGSERDHILQHSPQLWDTFQGGFCDTIPSFGNGAFDSMQTKSRYASDESWATTKYWSSESWMTETYPQMHHRPKPYQGCPTPSSVLGSFFRRLSEKLHLRKPAPKVPVCVTGGSDCDGRRRRNRYNKRQANMLKFVEERLQGQDTGRSASGADERKGVRANRRYRPDQDTIHDSAVDLSEYSAGSSGVVMEIPVARKSGCSEKLGESRIEDAHVACFGAGLRSGNITCAERYPGARFHGSSGRYHGTCPAPV